MIVRGKGNKDRTLPICPQAYAAISSICIWPYRWRWYTVSSSFPTRYGPEAMAPRWWDYNDLPDLFTLLANQSTDGGPGCRALRWTLSKRHVSRRLFDRFIVNCQQPWLAFCPARTVVNKRACWRMGAPRVSTLCPRHLS